MTPKGFPRDPKGGPARGTVYAPPTALYTMTNITPPPKNSDHQNKKTVFCNELSSYAAYRPHIKTCNTVFRGLQHYIDYFGIYVGLEGLLPRSIILEKYILYA